MINECTIAYTVVDGKIILAKNRDRSYSVKIKIVRELINDVEMVYIIDEDTDWSEGMNCHGTAVINSALMVDADENEKKIAKKKGKPSEDGQKIRRALMFKKAADSLMSIINFTGNDKREVGVKGHTFLATPKHTYSIEMTSKHKPVIKKLSSSLNHVRTNHGYEYEDSGYTSGPSKKSSELRWEYTQKMLAKVKIPADVLNGMSSYFADDMRNNPYRNADMVKNPTSKDILSTTGQIMMNVTDLEMTVRLDKDKSKYLGIDDRTPDHYEPKIKIKVEWVKNRKSKI